MNRWTARASDIGVPHGRAMNALSDGLSEDTTA